MIARLIDDLTALDRWGNFYVIVGSSAGVLIGLQFVVFALIADRPIARVIQSIVRCRQFRFSAEDPDIRVARDQTITK